MITSTANAQIKNIVKLQKSSRVRKEQQVFLVEGIRMFREIPETMHRKTYVTEVWTEQLPKHWQEGNEYEVVSENVFREISDTMSPQGILSVVRQIHYERKTLLGENGEIPCVLLLENLQDPGNLGTILRTAEGAGVTGIMMSRDTVDVYNSKVVRATMGAVFRMPFYYEEQILDGLHWLQEQGICCYAAHLKGKEFYDYNYRTGCCFLIGNEGNGLTPEISKGADRLIRIPMQGNVESLNAATAATVLMYEAMRQRLRVD